MTTLFLTKLAAILNYFSAAVESAFKDDIYVEAHSFPPPNVARYKIHFREESRLCTGNS